MTTYHYAYRIGSRSYPRGISALHGTLTEAREAAAKDRAYGRETGRIRKVTESERDDARESIRAGVLPRGW